MNLGLHIEWLTTLPFPVRTISPSHISSIRYSAPSNERNINTPHKTAIDLPVRSGEERCSGPGRPVKIKKK